MKIIDIK